MRQMGPHNIQWVVNDFQEIVFRPGIGGKSDQNKRYLQFVRNVYITYDKSIFNIPESFNTSVSNQVFGYKIA